MLNEVYNAGRFISRGRGEHPCRVIDSDELIFVLRGELSMFEGNKQFHLQQGEWLILRRGKLHGGKAVYPKNLSFFWLHFRDLDQWLDTFPQSGKVLYPEQTAEYMQHFLNEQNRIDCDRSILELLFQLILKELQRQDNTGETNRNHTPLTVAAQEYLALHYMEEINLASTAGALRCNTEYLGRLFHKSTGMTFAEALNKKRIEEAAKLLTNHEYSIKETMQLCGFNDPAYFRRKFRFYYNQSPGKFRKNHTIGHHNTL